MKAVSYFGTGRTNRKAPCCNKKHCNRARRQQFACRFLHPDYTVGPGIAPGQHPQKVVADLEISLIVIARRLNFFVPLARSGNESSFLTASGESHPALKRTFWAEYNALSLSCQAPLFNFLTPRPEFAPEAGVCYTDSIIIRPEGICFYDLYHP